MFEKQYVLVIFAASLLMIAGLVSGAAPQAFEPFVINVRDAETGAGVGLVELRTVHGLSFLTDANGVAAIYEPGLMGAGEVYFYIDAPAAYEEWGKDGFGNRGKRFILEQGGRAEFTLKRKSPPEPVAEPNTLGAFRLANPYTITAGAYKPFEITVKDELTGRGVPLVELRTPEDLLYVTDSAGRIAFFEPGLMDKDVAFRIASYGYERPAGGVTFKTTPGGSGAVSIKRTNIAERLYRITGEGIYRDSVLLNKPVPLARPVLAGKVLGQDSTSMTEYKGRLFWLWGDTARPAYPLGNFKTSSATSLLPSSGGLDPDLGVNLEYFVDAEGFSRQMFPRKDAGLMWMAALATVDDGGQERLVGSWAALQGFMTPFERGMAVFNDATEVFEPIVTFGAAHNVPTLGQAYKRDGFVYIMCPYPVLRYRATLAAARDPNGYEAFTCLVPGAGYDDDKTKLERDAEGKLVWAWKNNTMPLDDTQWETLVKAGLVRQEEAFNWLKDVATGKHVRLHFGSAAYNAYKDCWVMVCNEIYGQSLVGEIWIAAAKGPQGPWTKAAKIVTHRREDAAYSFYNVVQHPVFERDGGRTIYFEGTYTATFSGNENPTPRYDYNQIMYKLDLSDPRLQSIFN